MRRILIVNVNWIGDTLFSTPFIRTVREAYPDSYIACLIHPRCKEMLEANPRLDELIIYDEEGAHKSLSGKLRLILSLRKRRFGTAFLLHRSFTKALIVFLAGIKERIGYPTKKRGMLLTKTVDSPAEELHKVEYFLNIAVSAGLVPSSRSYEFFISDANRDFIKELLRAQGISDNDTVVVLCPGGNWDPKRWPKEYFAKLADALAERCGAKIVISGAKKDITLAEDIKAIMKTKPEITAGKTTLKQLGALFARADLVVANDTGPMHLAVAMKAKTIALFGPTSPQLTGPYGEGRYKVIFKNDTCDVPCYDFTCMDNRCMSAIKVEDVLKESLSMLGEGAKCR
ncbi:MAG: lipopolysaccharide heptosyltransferase II [Candidatus Omnitrophica bacterium]|nr:lipopolysaccharide heptosyltransferase II [Candidatus Omnitrophota bacterium]